MNGTGPDTEPTSDAGTAMAGDEDAADIRQDRAGALAAIRETYDEQADALDRMEWVDRLLLGRYRRHFETAHGRVLDVACGTGTNVRYLPETVEYVGIDVSPAMVRRARERVKQFDDDHEVAEMDAEALAFPDDSFDTVISSLSTCTVPDPVAALREMNRVCAPDGRVLLVEHGRSSVEMLGRLQDWRAAAHFEKHRCRWNQDPLEHVSRAELSVTDASTAMLGVITTIEAEPS
ncbi:methylase involved in ubiquinone/menaquinone biosynthesis [Halovivax ruber XH-70]|uniref:Methylase involved in ubiquinone/menaquinone biosynthesis n=1 Tax=Halovivax ruber (strain DSM 18193 / JCM 13892 / XH-70) TaxID=797302 RepID=L0I7T1_HALRX|nr:class I SAM-dependent methyltransferase [Halovivax ruber]AGB14828.1 methylase involved in ubiquinone/menaquinone biosynthesis [Halovivax ruber XH-70]